MINQILSPRIAQHELVLHRLVSETAIPAERVKKAILYSLFPGGKRVRPMLVYLAGEILGVNQTCLDLIAASIELTHCYSLIHDDLPAMDNDDLRRGKPSCHKAFDEATAILAGDGMQALAIEVLLTHLPECINSTQVIEIVRELVIASGTAGMVSGQSLDLSELSKPALSEAKLRTIHELKTGKLISACIKMVVAAKETSSLQAEALINYASYLGLVFQMQDDYLDLYADILGKGRASDLINQKITFASLYSQSELLQLIDQYYLGAKEALNLLGEKSNDLLIFTDSLHQRTKGLA